MTKRRVVVTGMGAVTPIGNTLREIEANLRNGVSGIGLCEEFVEKGFSSTSKGTVKNFVMPEVPKNIEHQLGIGNQLRFAHVSVADAVDDAGLISEEIEKACVIYGQGGGSTLDTYEVGRRTMEQGRPRAPKANSVTPTMASGCSAEISNYILNKGGCFSVSAACATGNFAIGLGARSILFGDSPIAIVGSCDSTDWVMSAPFNVMPAMSRNRENLAPEQVSRPFDQGRSGFVMGEGAGCLVLEDLDHALARGANIYCELVGFGFSSDGTGHPTDPDRNGAMKGMLNALHRFDGTPIDANRISYVKTHGTSTAVGDDNELRAIAGVFKQLGLPVPRIGSTKSLTGHALGGAGSIESVFAIIMMNGGFLAPSLNIDEPSDVAKELGLVDALLRSGEPQADVDMVLANSFGFGGTNASLVFARYDG